eukprot:2192362-Amphidinium_carterae.1
MGWGQYKRFFETLSSANTASPAHMNHHESIPSWDTLKRGPTPYSGLASDPTYQRKHLLPGASQSS